jgi:hypothetical protein
MYTYLREVLFWQEEASGQSGDHFLTRAYALAKGQNNIIRAVKQNTGSRIFDLIVAKPILNSYTTITTSPHRLAV